MKLADRITSPVPLVWNQMFTSTSTDEMKKKGADRTRSRAVTFLRHQIVHNRIAGNTATEALLNMPRVNATRLSQYQRLENPEKSGRTLARPPAVAAVEAPFAPMSAR